MRSDKEETVLTDNELIAQFMNTEAGYDEYGVWQKLQYHSSWSWLMPVAEKIQRDHYLSAAFQETANDSFGYYVNLSIHGITWRQFYWIPFDADRLKDHEFRIVCKTKIEAVYKAAIVFIKWYNENTKV